MKRSSIRQKENVPYACEPRPSLRMTMTAKKKTQKQCGRMSVLPLKRQRMSVNLQTQQLTQSRPSLRTNINLMNTINTTPLHSCQRSIRKQTIINNLVNKLDEEQEIRSIIQTKLKRNFIHLNEGNSYGPNKQFMYTSQFQPYSSNSSLQVSQKNLTQNLAHLMDNTASQFNDGTNRCDIDCENNAVTVLSNKLRQCQDQLEYFKSIVSEMSKKMKIMERQQTNTTKTSNYSSGIKPQKCDILNHKHPHNFQQNYTSTNINTNRCANSCNCKCSGNNFNKLNHQNANQIVKLVDMNTQTDSDDNSISYKPEESVNYELDFFDNLDRTLKVLSNSKNL